MIDLGSGRVAKNLKAQAQQHDVEAFKESIMLAQA